MFVELTGEWMNDYWSEWEDWGALYGISHGTDVHGQSPGFQSMSHRFLANCKKENIPLQWRLLLLPS